MEKPNSSSCRNFFLGLLFFLIFSNPAIAQIFTRQTDAKWQSPQFQFQPLCTFDETIGQAARKRRIAYPAVPFYESGMLEEKSKLRLKLIGNFYTPDWEKTLSQIKQTSLEAAIEQTPILVKKGNAWEIQQKVERITTKTTVHYSNKDKGSVIAVEEKD